MRRAHPVVLAVEWGSGRRQGWLSNLHLGARDPESGQFVMLGKTFKGLTDEMLRWQAEKLLALEVQRDDFTVYVRPELVAAAGVRETEPMHASLKGRLLQAVDHALSGDWQAAHLIAQDHEGERLADWIHAVAHRMEGDLDNAAYWYRRCGRAQSGQLSTDAELRLIRDELAST